MSRVLAHQPAARLRALASLGVVLTAASTLLIATPASAAPAPGPTAKATAKAPAAKVTFGVQPASGGKPDARPSYSYGATAGSRLTDQVAVLNLGVEPIKVRVYAQDSLGTSDGTFALQAGSVKPAAVGAWLKLRGPADVTVPARSRLIIPVSLSVPADATPGDHAGAIIASLVSSAKNENGDQIRLDQRVGTRVLIRVSGPLRPALTVRELRATYDGTANPVGRGATRISYVVANTGNVRLSGHPAATVRGMLGNVVRVKGLADIPELLPGSSVRVSTSVRDVLPTGRLRVTGSIIPIGRAEDVNPTLTPSAQHVSVWAVPWTTLLALLLLALLVGSWAHRRRRGRRPPLAVVESEPQGRHMATGVRAVSMLAAMVVAPMLVMPSAAADDDGAVLTVTPATGTLQTLPTFRTTGPCPEGSDGFFVRAYGAGFPDDGYPLKHTGHFEMSLMEPFAFDASYNFRELESEAGTRIQPGRLELRMVCQNNLGSVFATYVAAVDFTAAGAYAVVTAAGSAPTEPATAGTPSVVAAAPSPGPSSAPVAPVAPSAGGEPSGRASPSASERAAAQEALTKASAAHQRDSAGHRLTSIRVAVVPPVRSTEPGPVALTALVKVVGGAAARGHVVFSDGVRTIAEVPLRANGAALAAVEGLEPGEHAITATFKPARGSQQAVSSSGVVPYVAPGSATADAVAGPANAAAAGGPFGRSTLWVLAIAAGLAVGAAVFLLPTLLACIRHRQPRAEPAQH